MPVDSVASGLSVTLPLQDAEGATGYLLLIRRENGVGHEQIINSGAGASSFGSYSAPSDG